MPYGHSCLKNVKMKDWLWKMVSQVVVFTQLELDQNFTTLEVISNNSTSFVVV